MYPFLAPVVYWESMIKDMSFASTPSPELCGPIAAQCRTRSISTRCWDRILPSCRTASTSITTLVSMIALVIANYFITTLSPFAWARLTGICRTADRGRGCISTVNICSSTAAARSSATRAMMKYRTKTIAGLVVTVDRVSVGQQRK